MKTLGFPSGNGFVLYPRTPLTENITSCTVIKNHSSIESRSSATSREGHFIGHITKQLNWDTRSNIFDSVTVPHCNEEVLVKCDKFVKQKRQ